MGTADAESISGRSGNGFSNRLEKYSSQISGRSMNVRVFVAESYKVVPVVPPPSCNLVYNDPMNQFETSTINSIMNLLVDPLC